MKISVRHFFELFLVFILLITAVTFAFAAETSTDNNSQDKKTIRLENREEIKTNVVELIDQRQEARSNVAKNHGDQLSKRFNLYYERLLNILLKLRTRLEKMTSEGKDVEDAMSKFKDAQMSLENAKSEGDQAVNIFINIEPENYEAQRDQALKAKDLANAAREDFKKTLELMKQTIQSAKNAAGEND